jgi:hypothetical protein
MIRLDISGIQRAEKRNLRRIARLRPENARQRAVKTMATTAHRWAVYFTPWQTGSLRASHRIQVHGARARVYIDPGATNPRSRTRPAVYGQYLHEQGMIPGLRGGIRAFYAYTVQEKGDRIAEDGAHIIAEEVDNA